MVVDDDTSMCAFLKTFLVAHGYAASAFTNAEDAVRHYQAERPAVIILDLVMPGRLDGLGALEAFKKIDRDVPVIVISGHGGTPSVVQAMKLGASDFVSKPFDCAELETPLANAIKQSQSTPETTVLRSQLQSASTRYALFGHSERMIEVHNLIKRVADTDVTVLIRGESGTGKELVARALHAASPRRNKPFVKVNCAALPAELLESELFGFERGAFTGAVQEKPGKFEFANHGTIFLDEIGDMSFPLQAKLLQVLQDGEFCRLAGRHDVHVDVRAVAATNRNLERAVADNQFREDLFFRLNVVSINLPPLRERREEIPVFTEHFLKKYSAHYDRPRTDLSHDTMQLFMQYAWPGNVRELENLIKRAIVLRNETAIQKELAESIGAAARRLGTPDAQTQGSQGPAGAQGTTSGGHDDAPHAAPDGAATADPLKSSLKNVSRIAARGAERELILKTLEHTRWNRKQTAVVLGISYKALLYKIKENNLGRVS